MATYASTEEWFEAQQQAEHEPDPKLTATFFFDIEGGGQYTLDIVEGEPSWSRGRTKEPTCTISASEENFLKMASGEMSATKALMLRRVKISGNMAQAMSLQKYAG